MNSFILATVSTADLDSAWLKEHDVPFISYTLTIDGQVYTDDCTKEIKHLVFQKMREGSQPNTSQITEYAYEEFFRGLMKTGQDVLFTDMSRAISASITNAEMAMERVRAEFPDQKLLFVDSYSITGGLAWLIRHMDKLRREGKTIDEVYEWAEATKLHVIHRFFVDDLEWLRRGGRLSNASAFVGSLLMVKPLLYVTKAGTLISDQKVRGRRKAVHALIDSCNNEMTDSVTEMIVLHADCEDDAHDLVKKLAERYPNIHHFHIMELGPVIGAHVGPDFLAVVFCGKERYV